MKKNNASSDLVLKFPSIEAREEFIRWYLEGGGEQAANFYTDLRESNWQTKVDPYLVLEDRSQENE